MFLEAPARLSAATIFRVHRGGRRICRLALLAAAALAPLASLAAESRLTNIAVRSTAGLGTDTLIVGFTIGGSGTKPLLLRGVGPTLTSFNVPGAVSDPELRVYNAAGSLLTANDNWGGSTTLATTALSVGAFALPSASQDAALVLNLTAGTYSAHLGAQSGPGIALVEAYDADPTATPSAARIQNVSARSVSGTGANVLTIGFSLSGDTPRVVLIRAVGPSLAGFGVDGALVNPQLRLFSSSRGEIGFNDDWLGGPIGWATTASDVGAFGLAANTRDAALLVRLPPGTYTAQAAGADNGTGVTLIEVYDVTTPRAGVFVYQPVENPEPPGYPRSVGLAVTPVVRFQARPVYPFELRVAGATGEALIQFVVGTDGRVSNAFALRAHDTRLAEAALAAVRQWMFQPGRNTAGQPIPVVMQVPIIFTLNE
jgi:TonB family protein